MRTTQITTGLRVHTGRPNSITTYIDKSYLYALPDFTKKMLLRKLHDRTPLSKTFFAVMTKKHRQKAAIDTFLTKICQLF